MATELASTTARSEDDQPVLLLIDDLKSTAKILPSVIEKTWRIDQVRSLDALRDYLRKLGPASPPLAALVDVHLGHEVGLAAVLELRKHDSTQRTVPILFTSTALARGELLPGTWLDLHAVFCAAACRTGIALCGKDQDDDLLAEALQKLLHDSRLPGVRPDQLVGVKLGGLNFVQPVTVTSGAAAATGTRNAAGRRAPQRSMMRTLLGTPAKRRLWSELHLGKDPVTALKSAMRTRPKPSRNLDGSGSWKTVGKDPLRLFVQGEIGELALAWDKAHRSFLHPSVTQHGVMPLVDAKGYLNPSTVFRDFAGRYADLLGSNWAASFAEWYFKQPWAD